MFRKIFIFFNPVTLFLLLNIVRQNELTLYYKFSQLERINYVNIGSSHGGYAIDYSQFSNSINLGIGGQRMDYGLKILESIEYSLDQNSIVIMPISFFSFCGTYDGPKTEYLGFLHRNEIEISYVDEILELYFPYLSINKVEHNIRESFQRRTAFIPVFMDNGSERANFHLAQSKKCGIIDNQIIVELKSFLERNNEMRIILIITPYYQTYWDHIRLEKDVVQLVHTVISKIVKEYSIEFIDYSDDLRFSTNPSYFIDSDHLNSLGAKFFTEILINDLSSLTYNTSEIPDLVALPKGE